MDIDSGDFGRSDESGTVRLGESGQVGGYALATGAGATTFTDLAQTPATLGTVGQILAMNAGGTELEWVEPGAGGGATDMKGLSDTPGIDAPAQAMLRMNIGGTAWEYVFLRLHELVDMDPGVSSATEGQSITWNDSSNLWEATTILGLPTLGTANQFLRVNGAGTAPVYSDVSLSENTDVIFTAPAEDDILQRDGAGVWRNVPLPGSLIDTYVVSGTYTTATSILQLTNNAAIPASFTVDLTHDFSELGNIDDADRGVGSFYWYDGANMKAIAAPALNQALKWSGTAWVYEDVLIVDANKEPDDTTVVANMYAAGTILVSDDTEDSFNPLPRGSANQALVTAGGNLRWNDFPVYQYADRSTAVAADWTNAIFPCILVITLDQLTTIAALSAVKQAWILTAAPTTIASPATEIPIGPRTFDENEKWANNIEPFPSATHGVSNTLARTANSSMTASNVAQADITAFQEWLPSQVVLGCFIIPKAEIITATRSDAMFRVNVTGQVTRWKVQVIDGDAVGNIASAVDVKLQYVGKGANISGIADFTDELTLVSESEIGVGGLDKFLTGAFATDGLLRESDRIYALFGTNVDTTYDLQITLYGYDLTSSTTRVVVV